MSTDFYSKIDRYKAQLSKISQEINNYAKTPENDKLAKKVKTLHEEFKALHSELTSKKLTQEANSLKKVSRLEGLKGRASFISEKYEAISDKKIFAIHAIIGKEDAYKAVLKSEAPTLLDLDKVISAFANEHEDAFAQFARLPQQIQDKVADRKPDIHEKRTVALALLRHHQKSILAAVIHYTEKKELQVAEQFTRLLPEKVMQKIHEQVKEMAKTNAAAKKMLKTDEPNPSVIIEASKAYLLKYKEKVDQTHNALDELMGSLKSSNSKQHQKVYHQFFQKVVPIWTNQSADKVVKLTSGAFDAYCEAYPWMNTMGFSRSFIILAKGENIRFEEAPRSSSSSTSTSPTKDPLEALKQDKNEMSAKVESSNAVLMKRAAFLYAREHFRNIDKANKNFLVSAEKLTKALKKSQDTSKLQPEYTKSLQALNEAINAAANCIKLQDNRKDALKDLKSFETSEAKMQSSKLSDPTSTFKTLNSARKKAFEAWKNAIDTEDESSWDIAKDAYLKAKDAFKARAEILKGRAEAHSQAKAEFKKCKDEESKLHSKYVFLTEFDKQLHDLNDTRETKWEFWERAVKYKNPPEDIAEAKEEYIAARDKFNQELNSKPRSTTRYRSQSEAKKDYKTYRAA